MARGSGSVRAKKRKNRPSFSLKGIGGGQGNRVAKGRFKKDSTDKPVVGTALSRSLAYFGDPEKGQQRIKEVQDAVAKFRGTNKKEDSKKSNNLVKNASVTKGGTKSLGKTTKKESDAGKKASEIINKKNPKIEKLRKQLGLTGDITMKDVASAVKGKLPDLVALGKKGKPAGQTKRQQRRATREDRVARRRAGKTAVRNFRQGKGTDQAQFDANVEAEKDLIRKRRAGRRQFLRNFASQLTTGENAPAEARNFEGRKKDFFNNQSTAANEGDKAEIEQNTNQFTDLLNTTSNDNSNFNNLLTPSTQPDPGNFLGTSNIKDFYKPGEFAVSPTLKVEEDSTPISAMRKEYNKKRGL